MKMLILGGHGMAGHIIAKYFKQKKNTEVYYTSRKKDDLDSIFLDVRDDKRLFGIINTLKPDIIINAIGILNDKATEQKIDAILVNSLLPHLLAEAATTYQFKLIHISTDCVFLGAKGGYTEADPTDGVSDYAKSKALGEIINDNHLTVRTSIIGPELNKNGIGLFQWFMKQSGEIKGYKNVYWNGVTTLELAKAIDRMITEGITGLYHLGKEEKISKYELLKLFQKVFNKQDVTIIPDEQENLDRTIVSTREDFKYVIPSYLQMLTELKDFTK